MKNMLELAIMPISLLLALVIPVMVVSNVKLALMIPIRAVILAHLVVVCKTVLASVSTCRSEKISEVPIWSMC
jgi:hypothetical protein